jgi:type 1 glutamine amidotransferase
MNRFSRFLFAAALVFGAAAQNPSRPAQPGRGQTAGARRMGPAPVVRKRVLVYGLARGWHHDSITDAMATVWKLGRESGEWDTEISTDADMIRKGPTPGGYRNNWNLNNFDAVVFASTTGTQPFDDQQKKDLLSFVHDDGKGFVGIHAALDGNYNWPEYAEMLGGWFDEHPWTTFDAPIIVEDPTFPAVRHFAHEFVKHDEIYQAKNWSRDKCNVLLRLDENKLKYDNNPRIHRQDHDFAVAWSKMYGKGRVFYSTLGHTKESWDDPEIQKMYLEAIKWVLGLTEGSTTPHPRVN